MQKREAVWEAVWGIGFDVEDPDYMGKPGRESCG